MSSFDLAVVGAGPGGYVAAIRAAQLGAKVALIERDRVGGVCLNRGCIPTKALIASAHAIEAARRASEFGVVLPAGVPAIDMAAVHSRKEGIVTGLRDGIATLLAGRGITRIEGTAAFVAPRALAVEGTAVEAARILIATGSTWIDLPGIPVDGERIVTSDEALDWTSLPESLAIVGGGVVGCEFACMMRAFGVAVTIIEATASILPPVERAVSRLLARAMKMRRETRDARGETTPIEILTNTTVASARAEGDGVRYALSTGEEREAARMLVAVGRRPNTAGLGLELAGIACTERGFIHVDERFQTSAEGVFAIGDVIGGRMLAHAASHAGIRAVEGMFQQIAPKGNPDAIGNECKPAPEIIIPSPIFTIPEVASIGLTAEDLKAKGVAFTTGRFSYAACGKALCDGETEGQAIVHAAPDGRILGVHLIGRDATTLIAEAALAMSRGLSAEDVAAAVHAHPTLSEALAEACEDVRGMAVHKATLRHETRDTRRETKID